MRVFQKHEIPKPTIAFIRPEGPVDLEIGAGQGLHAIRYCQSNPGRSLLAVEKTHERFAKLQKRRQTHADLNNLHIFHADAVAFVTHCLTANSLDRIFLLYPNPYPKAKQANLRWHNRPFLAQLLSCLKPDGQLTLATNEHFYAVEAADRMVQTWGLKLVEFSAVQGDVPPRTHFEKKYLERGETCWNLNFCKNSDKAVQ